MNEIAHTRSTQPSIDVTNRGATPTQQAVELIRSNTTKDSVSVDLAIGETTSISLQDGTFGEADINSILSYDVAVGGTGGVEPSFQAKIIGLLDINATDSLTAPSYDVGRIEWDQGGKLELTQGDTIGLHN
jgi:hypothetical protein